ncbi:MAG TPA: SAM-dependent methyltransferase [Micromonosporaceae bacterium]|nr:SAM-dependent methyltransferase [Micromonosporaceae bacterium]
MRYAACCTSYWRTRQASSPLRDAVVPGSYLAISHLSQESRPRQTAGRTGTAKRGGMEMAPRSRSEVQRFFTGLELVEPGVVCTHEWRPDPAGGSDGKLGRPVILCGLGRKV